MWILIWKPGDKDRAARFNAPSTVDGAPLSATNFHHVVKQLAGDRFAAPYTAHYADITAPGTPSLLLVVGKAGIPKVASWTYSDDAATPGHGIRQRLEAYREALMTVEEIETVVGHPSDAAAYDAMLSAGVCP